MHLKHKPHAATTTTKHSENPVWRSADDSTIRFQVDRFRIPRRNDMKVTLRSVAGEVTVPDR
jgi:hypothetical protein